MTVRLRRSLMTMCVSRRLTSFSTSGGQLFPRGRPTALSQASIYIPLFVLWSSSIEFYICINSQLSSSVFLIISFVHHRPNPSGDMAVFQFLLFCLQVPPARPCATTGSTGYQAVGPLAWPPEPHPDALHWHHWLSRWSFQQNAVKTMVRRHLSWFWFTDGIQDEALKL